MAPISPITVPIATPSLATSLVTPGAAATGASFQNLLHSAIQNVEASSASASSAVQGYLAGGPQELHSTILAAQSAELDFEMFLQVRNKVVSAYEEIMRMQI
ncbi:MAG TPA: flagellar hook-basal body complex protein FliE [Bryobacteraceae bacterium]|nr:flagellar hook-basal body complex protein FliE [Bryobacteraceae bacterium]